MDSPIYHLERVVKAMMLGLLLILVLLVLRAVTLPGAGEGITFYLAPDVARLREAGLFTALNEAIKQAFFTISLGVGSITIFCSYDP